MPPHEHAPPIVALATPPGHSAIAVVRLSGPGVISIVNQLFRGKDLTQQATHTLHLGTIVDEAGEVLDEVLIAIFRAPHSFTQEESVEISCHGSPYVVQQLVQLLVRHGVRLAQPGEFTQRAFLHGRFDLAQAEAVADLIAADSAAAHRMAMHQMRGQFSAHIQALRAKLLHFAAMLELELDFAEEDVAFADRAALKALLQDLLAHIEPLVHGFALGNAVKSGVHTVIAGKPNAGKSTLLNALLNEERAIVSDTPGTTRDLIEDKLNVGGISFRLVDTAGLRHATADAIEALGIAKTKEQLQKAALILHLFDLSTASIESIRQTTAQLQAQPTPYIRVGNKIDAAPEALLRTLAAEDFVLISAAKQQNLQALTDRMVALAAPPTDAVVVNARHYEHLTKSQAALEAILQSIENQLSTELLAQDVRTALDELGAITGEVTTDELLGHIFAQFCIGK